MHIQTNTGDTLCQLESTVRLGGVAKYAKGREHMFYLKIYQYRCIQTDQIDGKEPIP